MKFEFNKWDVELIQDPIRLMNKLKELNIKDKTIKNIRILGFVDKIGNSPYDIENVENDKQDNYLRKLIIDDPVIIEFTDGDRLEIDYTEGSSIKIGLNSLPKNIVGNTFDQVDGSIFFSNCINKKIVGFSVEMEDGEHSFDFTGSYGIELDDEQEFYIVNFRLILTECYSLLFNSHYDYGVVSALECSSVTSISKKDLLKSILIKEI